MTDPDKFSRYREIIDDWRGFQAAIRRPLPKVLWANTLRITPEALRALLGPELVPLPWSSVAFKVPDELAVGKHWAYLAGLFNIQEEVSMLPVHALDLHGAQRVLDLCAAPGNKTAQISVRIGESGSVIANDRSIKRMRAVGHTFERLGLLNIATTTYDARRYPRPECLFDRVLADVPCSGEGTCRKNRRSVPQVSEEDALRMAETQRGILRNAIRLCRPGGRIVYSTCTFAPEENECVLDAVLRESQGAVRLLPAQIPGFHASPGLTAWQGRTLDPSLRHGLRVWPHQQDTGGFFVAVLERTSSGAERSATQSATSPTDTVEEERDPWLPLLQERYDIDPRHFAALRIVRGGRKSVYVSGRHSRPEAPADAVGMRFVHTKNRPTMTTAAAIRFGALANRHIVDLDQEQLRAYVSRRDVILRDPQTTTCTSTGTVIVRYRGYPLGQGLFHLKSKTLESHYPKGWARAEIIV
ncbi:MAG: NOL1/NOP2/sun family putative RNA methylase [Nannocystaceae bacterium]